MTTRLQSKTPARRSGARTRQRDAGKRQPETRKTAGGGDGQSISGHVASANIRPPPNGARSISDRADFPESPPRPGNGRLLCEQGDSGTDLCAVHAQRGVGRDRRAQVTRCRRVAHGDRVDFNDGHRRGGASASLRRWSDDDGAGNRTRTYDPRITNALLYQLSYPGAGPLASQGRAFYIFLRSRITRSMPATSVPGGGAGRRLNSTAGTGTSIRSPLERSWK
jgi:hypothetical protein